MGGGPAGDNRGGGHGNDVGRFRGPPHYLVQGRVHQQLVWTGHHNRPFVWTTRRR